MYNIMVSDGCEKKKLRTGYTRGSMRWDNGCGGAWSRRLPCSPQHRDRWTGPRGVEEEEVSSSADGAILSCLGPAQVYDNIKYYTRYELLYLELGKFFFLPYVECRWHGIPNGFIRVHESIMCIIIIMLLYGRGVSFVRWELNSDSAAADSQPGRNRVAFPSHGIIL